jgi:hypothetical protein
MSPATRTITPETREKINEALKVLRDRGATNDYCPRCSKDSWDVDLLVIRAAPLPDAALARGFPPTNSGYIPVLSVVCTTCGYTMLHNLNPLGIDYGATHERA